MKKCSFPMAKGAFFHFSLITVKSHHSRYLWKIMKLLDNYFVECLYKSNRGGKIE